MFVPMMFAMKSSPAPSRSFWFARAQARDTPAMGRQSKRPSKQRESRRSADNRWQTEVLASRPGNCSCIALGCCSRRSSTSSFHGVVPSAILGGRLWSLTSTATSSGPRPECCYVVRGPGGDPIAGTTIRVAGELGNALGVWNLSEY